MGTIRRTRDHPRRQEGLAFRTRDRRMRPLQTKNQNVALQPQPVATHEYEIDSPSKRPAASVPLSTRDPPIPNLSPCLLTGVIPYEGGPWPTFRIVSFFLDHSIFRTSPGQPFYKILTELWPEKSYPEVCGFLSSRTNERSARASPTC